MLGGLKRSLPLVAEVYHSHKREEAGIGPRHSHREISKDPTTEILYPCWPGDYPAPGKKQCFHVMPFSEARSDSVRDAARAVCKARGYEYRRGDEAEEGRVIRAIWDDLCRAHLVLTDLTGLNLNVLIELGMAHALGRETLLAAHIDNQGEKLPRNIQKLRVLYYEDPAEIDDWMVRRRAVTS